jgi:hypothetical protein
VDQGIIFAQQQEGSFRTRSERMGSFVGQIEEIKRRARQNLENGAMTAYRIDVSNFDENPRFHFLLTSVLDKNRYEVETKFSGSRTHK